MHGCHLPRYGVAVGVTSGGATDSASLGGGLASGGSTSNDVEQQQGESVTPAADA